MNLSIRILLLSAIVATFISLSSATDSTEDEPLTRVRRAKKDDDEPSQEDIDAVRASLDRRPKVARPAYSAGPGAKGKGKGNHGPLPPEVVEEEERKPTSKASSAGGATKGGRGSSKKSKKSKKTRRGSKKSAGLATRRLSPSEKSRQLAAAAAARA